MNIVFDLGGVLLDWNPDKIIEAVFPGDGRHQRIRSEVFDHPDWLDLDRGTLDPSKAKEGWVERAQITAAEAAALMDEIPRSLTPLPESQKLLRQLSASGTPLFCLSNMHTASIAYIEKTYPFWDLFEGTVISCRLHMNKPEPEIYQHLLNEFSLEPSETVFIDDTAANVEAARHAGILGIRFETARQCKKELRALVADSHFLPS